MRRRLWSYSLVFAIVASVAATVAVLGQAAGPFGVADATARNLLVQAVLSSDGNSGDLVPTVARAYAKIPAAARGPATAAAFAWAKSYVSSPAFAAAYAKQREGQRPQGVENVPSVDDQLKKMMDEQAATMVLTRKMAESLPEKDRAAFLENLKEQEAQAQSPERLKILRAALEAERGGNVSSSTAAFAEWEAKFPANPNAFVRGHLQRFLKVTANVDYSLPTYFVRGPSGEVIGFLSPGYTGIPWQHIHAIVAGKEALDAGRAAAAAWLKEIEGT